MQPARVRRQWPWLAALGVFLVAVIGLGVLVALGRFDVSRRDRDARHRDAAVAMAEKDVLLLLSASPTTIKDNVTQLLKNTTADFHDQFAKQAGTFEDQFLKSKITSVGTVQASAVSSFASDKAVVVIAAQATVKSPAKPTGENRTYRIVVTLLPGGDSWQVSDLEYVA